MSKHKPAAAGLQASTPAAYILVSHVDHTLFQDRVTALMAEGWQPIGGVALGEYHEPESRRRMPGYHQAMVRR
jgi:hypothetical protein